MDTLPEYHQYAACVGQNFLLRFDNADDIELELVQAKMLMPGETEESEPLAYSILFRGPSEPVLPQASYRLEHEELGQFIIFLVNVGPDDSGTLYDATFNNQPILA